MLYIRFDRLRVLGIVFFFLLFLNGSYGEELTSQRNSLTRKTTEGTSDNSYQCGDLPTIPEPCNFLRSECGHLKEGLVDYLELYYCELYPTVGSVVGVSFLVLALTLAFTFLSTIASGFFCPNLAALADSLHLSENVAGVTFLAFGNGSPDLFSTFSSFKANSGALAIGELVGASWFIISVVVGSMAIITSFQLNRYLFLRDILFFTGAVLFILFIIWDQVLTPWESLLLSLCYVGYVLVVIFFKPNPTTGEFPMPVFYNFFSRNSVSIDNEEDELESLLLSNVQSELSESTTPLISQLSLNTLSDTKSNCPMATPLTYYKRINFWTAEEITQALQKSSVDFLTSSSGTGKGVGLLPFSSIPSHFTTTKTSSVNSDSSNESLYDFLHDGIDTNHQPEPPRQSGRFTRSNAPESIFIPDPDSHPTIPHIIFSNATSPEESPVHLDTVPSLRELLFPGLKDWYQQSLLEKSLNLVCLPFTLLLTLTVPTPNESKETGFMERPLDPNLGFLSLFISKFSLSTTLGCLQSALIPLFLFEILLVNNDIVSQHYIYWPIFLGFSLTLSHYDLLVLSHQYFPSSLLATASSFLGFFLALCWISTVATEVVGILKAVGIVLGINEEILGLTVFAMGNSLGDFVANLSVARMGFPTMAVSACFAGPMLNMMLGPGLAGAYFGFRNGHPIPILVSRTMGHAAVGVLLTLIIYIVYMSLHDFQLGRKFGTALILIYSLGMISNILLS